MPGYHPNKLGRYSPRKPARVFLIESEVISLHFLQEIVVCVARLPIPLIKSPITDPKQGVSPSHDGRPRIGFRAKPPKKYPRIRKVIKLTPKPSNRPDF